MTLDTRVYVHDPIDICQVFVKCNQLLGADEGTRCEEWRGGLMNSPGQGLDAWLSVLPGQDDGVAVTVSFDTAYGYQGAEGGCGDLHVRLVRQLGEWLDGRGVRWSWLNEWTGDVYQGTDGLETLGTWPREEHARARSAADR